MPKKKKNDDGNFEPKREKKEKEIHLYHREDYCWVCMKGVGNGNRKMLATFSVCLDLPFSRDMIWDRCKRVSNGKTKKQTTIDIAASTYIA